MTQSNYTHLTLVVDRSGSMQSISDDAQGGITQLINEQFAEDGTLTITMVEFDEQFNDVARMATEPFEYQLRPRGSTALLDTVGREVTRTGEDLAALPEDKRPSRVLFVIVTDGQENASTEYTLETVRAAINRQRISFGWEFQFIGAGEAAWQGRDLDVAYSLFNKTGKGQRGAFKTMNDSMKRYRKGTDLQFDMPEIVEDDPED